ncbi:glycoside hydrolase family 10 protein [Scytonema sp. NUACC21]
MYRFIRHRFIYFICLGFALSTLLFSLPFTSVSSQNVNSPSPGEIRGVWLTNVGSGVLFVPWGINRALSQLSALKFNTVYPVVWNRGHTFYKSALLKQEIGLDTQPLLKLTHSGGDALATIVKLGSQKKLRVIPWFEYGLMLPANSALARYHPDWLTTEISGVPFIEDTLPEAGTGKVKLSAWQQFISLHTVKKLVWLNPLHPKVKEFIKGLILEVVTNYDVDGIQLDDHFGMPVNLGYDSFSIKLYQQEHEGQKPPLDPFDPEWMRWRSDKITIFMQEIVESVKAVKPSIQISLSPNSQRFAYKYYLQDWESWVNNNLIDELVLQVYRHNQNSFLAELAEPAVQNTRRKIPVSVGIITGTWGNPVNIRQIREQVKVVKEQNFNGVSFFYWETLWSYMTPESPQQRRKAFLEMFPVPS